MASQYAGSPHGSPACRDLIPRMGFVGNTRQGFRIAGGFAGVKGEVRGTECRIPVDWGLRGDWDCD